MGIQPIDLQTLFSQMDKVGKTQSDQTEGAQIQQAVQGALTQRRVEERSHSVNEAPDAGNGLERIKDKKSKKRGDRYKKSTEKEAEEAEEERSEIVTDPNLGKNIDLSG